MPELSSRRDAGTSTSLRIPRRGGTERVAIGGARALVTDVNVGPASVNPPSFDPTTRQLRLFSLDESEPRLVRVLSELSWRECPPWPLVAVSADGALGVDAAEGEPTLRVWDLASGAALDTIDLAAADDRVRAVAFGGGRRLYVETVRGRVFGYERSTPPD